MHIENIDMISPLKFCAHRPKILCLILVFGHKTTKFFEEPTSITSFIYFYAIFLKKD